VCCSCHLPVLDSAEMIFEDFFKPFDFCKNHDFVFLPNDYFSCEKYELHMHVMYSTSCDQLLLGNAVSHFTL